MEEDRERRVRAKSSGDEIDRLSNLPESLLCQVLLNLPTKDVVKTSVLSHRWRDLWRYVPGLDLKHRDFSNHNVFVNFVDSFLGFNSESRLQNFKLLYDWDEYDEPDACHLTRWMHIVVDRKIRHLEFKNGTWYNQELKMPLNFYTCERLVSLKLCGLTLTSPKFVSLPCLKVLVISRVTFGDDFALETIISGCTALESLDIDRSFCDDSEVLRVRSQSLLSFSYGSDGYEFFEELVVAIDAPRLKYLSLRGYRITSFILNNPASLVQAEISAAFTLGYGKKFDPNDLQKRIMIRDFLRGISIVKEMIIASSTLDVFYDYSRCERLPLFTNLSSLRVEFFDYRWEMLPIFLESCPNLKSLVVGSIITQDTKGISIISGPRCLLPSLEYVEIERPLKGEAKEMELVSYLLENSTILTKLTLRLENSRKKDESVILRELLTIPRFSIACQVVVL